MGFRVATYLATRLASLLPNRLSGIGLPAVYAGADQTFDLLGAAPGQLSGTVHSEGPTTYLWTKVSGTAAVTFGSATSLSTTFTVDVAGGTPLTLRLTATNAAGSVSDDVVVTVVATRAVLLSRLGLRVTFWYEVGVSTEVLNGSNFSSLSDLGPNSNTAVQATSGNQPAKVSSGGPNNLGYLDLQSTVRFLNNPTVNIPAGRFYTSYAVIKCVSAAIGVTCHARDAAGGAGNPLIDFGNFDATHFFSAVTPQGGAAEIQTITTPALNTNWNVHSVRYASGVAPVSKIGSTTTSPGFLVASGAATNMRSIQLGHASAARGSLQMYLCVEDCTTSAGSACLSEDAAIRYFINQQAGV